MPLLMAASYTVSVETPLHGARLGASFIDSWRGLLHLRQHLHHRLRHQVYSLIRICRWNSGIQASSPTPTKHRRRESTPPTCPCIDEVHHHTTCSCWAPTLGDGKTSCPVRRGGHFTGRVPTRRRPLHQPVQLRRRVSARHFIVHRQDSAARHSAPARSNGRGLVSTERGRSTPLFLFITTIFCTKHKEKTRLEDDTIASA
ncbi:hypothetical protein BRADI_2g16896v3 [Brachypodium distachyon]|uniref:Uncharacterized protein n=1 Tax=Brachypodium distachyon TaxID=15368 RepID=A0A0Q3K2F5_BRADI|nr:hypothetical protein BRADI_2g16896v3 [Brachypodium distachyon]